MKEEKTNTNIVKNNYCEKCGTKLDIYTKKCPNCKPTAENVIVYSKYASTYDILGGKLNVKIRLTSPLIGSKEVETYTRNNLKYHIIETVDNNGYTYTRPFIEYNELYAYYKFLLRCPILNKNKVLKEFEYNEKFYETIGVESITGLYNELVAKGFYEKASNSDTLYTYKVSELKDLAKKFNIKVKGKKEEIVEQIITQVSEDKLSNELIDTIQSISEYGELWLKEHNDEYDYYNSSKEFDSLEEYKKFWQTHDYHTERKKDCLNAIQKDKRLFGRFHYNTLIGLLKEENDMNGVTICYLKELLLELSGALNWETIERCSFDKIKMFKYMIIGPIPPHLKMQFPKYKKYYLSSMIEEAYKIALPLNICSKEDFKDFAEIMFDGMLDEETEKSYVERLKNKLRIYIY